MEETEQRLLTLLTGFREKPTDRSLLGLARQLADEFTLDQLEQLAGADGEGVREVFEILLNRPRWSPKLPDAGSTVTATARRVVQTQALPSK